MIYTSFRFFICENIHAMPPIYFLINASSIYHFLKFRKFQEISIKHNGYTPKVKTTPKCKSCSLKDICLPKLCKNISVAAYYSKNLGADEK